MILRRTLLLVAAQLARGAADTRGAEDDDSEFGTLSLDDKALLDWCAHTMRAPADDDYVHLRSLIDAGANPSAQDRYGYSCAMYAVIRNNSAVLGGLLDEGANASATNAWLRDALFLASWESCVECTRLLLQAGAVVHRPVYSTMYSPLLKAAELRHIEVARLLLDAGADPLAKCEVSGGEAVSALDLALKSGDPALIELFGGEPRLKEEV